MHDHSGHSHGIEHRAQDQRRLGVVLVITVGVLVLQVIGAFVSDSLALLADAGHMLTDSAALVLAYVAMSLARRPANPRRTFGAYRVEILAASFNALVLVGLGVFIVIESVQRWNAEPDVLGVPMLVFASVGLLANIVGVVVLRSGAQRSLNLRGAYLEVLGDALGSVAAIVAAVVIITTGWTRADVIASLLVAAFIVPRAVFLLRDAVDVLLEATPRGMDLAQVREHILGVPGVVDVHDMHAWTITSGMPVMSAHVVVDDAALAGGGGPVLDALGTCLADHFDVGHCTFQLESVEHAGHEPELHS